MEKNSVLKSRLLFLFIVVFVYVMLFEFILQINKILPRPSLLIETFLSIWPVYSLFKAFAITTTVVYLSLAAGYLIVVLRSRFIIKISYELSASIETLKVFRYFPPFFAAILFAFWFKDSIAAELVFGLVTVNLMLTNKLFLEAKKVKQEYLLTGKNLGLTKNEIYSKIIWKSVEPVVFKELNRIHYFLWIIIVTYEFITNIQGFGGVYRTALLFNDYSAFISIAIFISLIIWLGNWILSLLQLKLFYWED